MNFPVFHRLKQIKNVFKYNFCIALQGAVPEVQADLKVVPHPLLDQVHGLVHLRLVLVLLALALQQKHEQKGSE